MKVNSTKIILIFLLVLITLGQFGVDLFLPSLPHIAKSLNTAISSVKLTVPVYLLGLGISQLFYGPISDCIGRKPTLLVGLTLFGIGSLGCALANGAAILTVFRIIQGFGAGAAIVRAIMRDAFHGKQMAKASALVVMVWSVTPIVAPVIGGYIQTYLGWRANFAIMLIYASLIWMFVFFRFPETLDDDHKKDLNIRLVLGIYKKIFSCKLFLAFSLMSSFCYGYFISFATASPFLFQNQLGLSPVQFGWTLLVIAFGTALGSIICRHAVARFKITQIIFAGSLCTLIATLVMTLLAWVGIFNVASVLIPPFFGSIGGGMLFPNCTTGAMTPYKANAGAAGAALGFIQMFNSFIFTAIISYVSAKTALPLSLELLVISILMFVLFMTYIRFHFEEEEEIHA
ncbi:MAG: multidrug effflux MFS transporter [Candidatus Algichlamydia australiensis]|nr:multidrug effflux MFS transporter [Chlamydiales bacterium]